MFYVPFTISSMHWLMFSTLIFVQISNPQFLSKQWLPQSQQPWPYGSSAALKFSESEPLVPGRIFDHNATSTSSVCLVADVPKSSQRLFCFVLSLFSLLCPSAPKVRQVVGLLIVLSENVPHIIIYVCHWVSNFTLSPRKCSIP